MIEEEGQASALAAAIEKLPRHIFTVTGRNMDGSHEAGRREFIKLSDVLALLAGVSAERSEKTK